MIGRHRDAPLPLPARTRGAPDVRMVAATIDVRGCCLDYAVSSNALGDGPVRDDVQGLAPRAVSARARAAAAAEPGAIWAVNLHGFLAGGQTYWRESARLAAATGWRVVNPSLPGFGGSDPFHRERPHVRHFVAAVEALLDHLGVERAVVLGHSMGGKAAVGFAHDHPDRTLGVVYRGGAATMSWIERRGIGTRLSRGPFRPLGTLADLGGAFYADIGRLLRNAELGRMGPTARGDFVHSVRNLPHTVAVWSKVVLHDMTEEVHRVAERRDVPLLSVWGRDDCLAPHWTAAEFERITGAAPVWVDGGHIWPLSHPTVQADILTGLEAGRRFLEQVDRRHAGA